MRAVDVRRGWAVGTVYQPTSLSIRCEKRVEVGTVYQPTSLSIRCEKRVGSGHCLSADVPVYSM